MKKSIAIIGGGPSALFTAVFLDSNKFDITIYEKKIYWEKVFSRW
ncbi:NAD(P)-binding protein [Tenacibaculum retecalamus]|nr:FAD/NAD(P)-binding protein [Tenacibaculum retecalamus]WBX72172.1 NAD(P)/FAD-dependent oxidoreductase [Tenacibaculum retecalamus]